MRWYFIAFCVRGQRRFVNTGDTSHMKNESSFSIWSVCKVWHEFLFSLLSMSRAQRESYGEFFNRSWSLEADDSISCSLLSPGSWNKMPAVLNTLCRLWLWSLLHQPSASKRWCCGSQHQSWLLTVTLLKFITYVQIWFSALHMIWFND